MPTYSYKVLKLKSIPTDFEKQLNKLGKDGWELVSLVPSEINMKGQIDNCLGYETDQTDGILSSYTAILKKEC